MTFHLRFLMAACAGIALFGMTSTSSLHANLITNGSFESGRGNANATAFTNGLITALTPEDPTDLTGWKLEGTSGTNSWAWLMRTNNSYGAAQDGDRFTNISPDIPISQNFPVTGNTTYTVSYYEAIRADGSGQPDSINATISLAAGTATGTTTQNAHNTLTNNTANPQWQQFSFSFTPDTSTTATLRFSQTGGNGYPVLDNVDVSAVPEPNSLSLIGLCGAGLLARRRRV